MEKNLHNEEAVKKLKEMVSDIRTCIMITSGKTGARASRPMAAVETDHLGNIWFFTSLQSNKIKDIELDHFVQLVFAHPGKDSYLDIRGRANVITDTASIKEKWTPLVKAWFPDGSEDPNLCLLQIKTDEVHYWDTTSSKMINMLKAAISVVAGKPLVEGVHGELNVGA
jgi:general stress protein 26